MWRLLSKRDASIESDGFPRLLDAKQLAEHLAVPESWVREQARMGELPRIKLRHYVRFRLDDVQAFLTGKNPSQSPLRNRTTSCKKAKIPERPPLKETLETIWPPSDDTVKKPVAGELATVLTAWITVLSACVVDESGFFLRLKRLLKNTSRKPS